MAQLFSALGFIVRFARLSPFRQFWLNIIIPFCGLLFFNWTPGAVLFCFMIELVNYWLCNVVLLQFYVTNEPPLNRAKHTLKFSGYFMLSLIGFYYFITMFTDGKSAAMRTNVTYGQIITITVLYWLQFARYLYLAQPKGKVTTAAVTKEVFYRMTGIYLVLFCVMTFVFSFWSSTNVANYALAFVLVFAKSLTDLVIVAIRIGNEKNRK